MIKIKYIFPLFLFLGFLYFVYGINSKISEKHIVENGVIDLSDYEINSNGPIALNGKWAFFFGKTVNPGDVSSLPDGYMDVPAEWSTYNFSAKKYSNYGFASYRVIIKGIPENSKMALKVRECGTAYEILINGKKAAVQGSFSEKPENGKPDYKPQVVFFEGKQNTEIVVHISNYHHRASGIWYSILVGTEEDIIKLREKKLSLEMFFFGILIIMGMYYISIYILRNKEVSALYFGVFCLLIAMRIIVTGENFMQVLIGNKSWELMRKVEYLTFYFTIPLFYSFARTIFPKYISKYNIYVSLVIVSIFTLMTCFTDIKFYS